MIQNHSNPLHSGTSEECEDRINNIAGLIIKPLFKGSLNNSNLFQAQCHVRLSSEVSLTSTADINTLGKLSDFCPSLYKKVDRSSNYSPYYLRNTEMIDTILAPNLLELELCFG